MNQVQSPVRRVLSRRTIIAFAALGSVILVGLLILGYVTATQLQDAFRLTDQTIAIRAQLRIVRIGVTDMEANQRSYLVSGDEAYLELYRSKAATIDADAEELLRRTGGGEQGALLARMRTLIADKRADLDREIEARRSAGIEAARALIARHQSKRLLDQIRTTGDTLEKDVVTRMAAGRNELNARLSQSVLLGVLFAGVLVLLLGLIYYLLRRDIAVHADYEDTLAAANSELEGRVVERTRLLEENRARLDGIVNGAPAGIISIDEAQRVVLANPAAAAIFGYVHADMIGMPIERLIPERFRAGHGEHVQRFGASAVVTRRMAALRIVHALRADGTEFPVDASISQVAIGGRKLYTVILRDITDDVRARNELERSRRELRDLTTALEYIQEEERKRIARELHDDLGQQITVLKMDASLLRGKLAPDQTDALRIAERIQNVLARTVQSVRRLQSDLRPAMLDDLGLVPALEELVQHIGQHSTLDCRLAADDTLDVPEAIATPLYRIAQESLNNVVKHAEARRVTVALARESDRLVLSVTDDGKGIASVDRGKRKTYGLIGMRERIYALGGEFEVKSNVPSGTIVEARVPLSQ
jgi:PAS domain S-box-containing protein